MTHIDGHPPQGSAFSTVRNPKKFVMIELADEKGARSGHLISGVADADFTMNEKVGFHLGVDKGKTSGTAYDVVKWTDHEVADAAWDKFRLGKLEDCTPEQIRGKLNEATSDTIKNIWIQSADYLASNSGKIVYPRPTTGMLTAKHRRHPFSWLKTASFVIKPTKPKAAKKAKAKSKKKVNTKAKKKKK